MEEWEEREWEEEPGRGEAKPPLTILGLDLYLIAFVAIGGAFVLLAIYWILFSSLPMPRYCSQSRTVICSWVDRLGREVPAPWAHVTRPRG